MIKSLIDQYSPKPELKVNGNKRFDNLFGKLMGIFIILSNIIFTSVLFTRLLKKGELNILLNIENDLNGEINLIDDFPYEFHLTNTLGEEYEEPDRLYEIKINYITMILSNGMRNITIQSIPIDKYKKKQKIEHLKILMNI